MALGTSCFMCGGLQRTAGQRSCCASTQECNNFKSNICLAAPFAIPHISGLSITQLQRGRSAYLKKPATLRAASQLVTASEQDAVVHRRKSTCSRLMQMGASWAPCPTCLTPRRYQEQQVHNTFSLPALDTSHMVAPCGSSLWDSHTDFSAAHVKPMPRSLGAVMPMHDSAFEDTIW